MSQFNLQDVTALFKIKYLKLSDNVYNSANVLLGRVKKDYNFTGKQLFTPVPKSFQGGVGAGSLPAANHANYEEAIMLARKVYSVVEIDRETIKASMNDEGAFVRGTKEVVQKGVESYMRNISRILFGGSLTTGTFPSGLASPATGSDRGSLGQFAGGAAGTAADPIITVTAASFKEANWEERDYLNVEDAGGPTLLASVFEVVDVDPTTRQITLTRISGTDDLTALGAGPHDVFMQNSLGAEPTGLKGVVDAVANGATSMYNVNVDRRWQATRVDAGGAGLSTDRMNEVMLEVQRKSGKVPNMIMTSFTQFRKLLNLLEDQKQYILEPRSKDLKGKISFRGIEFMSSAGAIPVFPERFCEDDRMYFLNDNYITIYHRPDFGWFEDDGTVFLRKADSDAYEARYGGYCENYIVPSFQGALIGLAV